MGLQLVEVVVGAAPLRGEISLHLTKGVAHLLRAEAGFYFMKVVARSPLGMDC